MCKVRYLVCFVTWVACCTRCLRVFDVYYDDATYLANNLSNPHYSLFPFLSQDPFRKTKPRVPTMEEELSNLFNALKTGRMPSSMKGDGSKSSSIGDKELSASKIMVDDLTGEEFAMSNDPLSQGSGKRSDGSGSAENKVTTMLPSTAVVASAAGEERSDHVYTPEDIDNMSYKEIEQRYRLLTCQDEVLKAIVLRTPEGVNDVLGQEDGVVISESAEPLVDLFGGKFVSLLQIECSVVYDDMCVCLVLWD